jgi:hypothetical protein
LVTVSDGKQGDQMGFWKYCTQFLSKLNHNGYRETKYYKNLGHFSNYPKEPKVAITYLISIWCRCYDHNFLRFFPIFCDKIDVFLKYQCYDHFVQTLALFWVKNVPIVSLTFLAKIF